MRRSDNTNNSMKTFLRRNTIYLAALCGRDITPIVLSLENFLFFQVSTLWGLYQTGHLYLMPKNYNNLYGIS